jgi:DNA repair protein SbcD/Mre11
MKIAHLADLHVGFRRFDRSVPKTGLNQREADVQLAVSRAFDDVIGQRPDIILFAGDVFHSVRPPNGAILFMFAQLQRLRQALPAAKVVMVSGDHDSPRSIDAGVILPLFRALGLQVAANGVERFPLAEDVLLTAVPKLVAHKVPEPQAGVRNVLLIHGEVPGLGAPRPVGGGVDVGKLSGWDYVAMGHWHVCTQVAPNAWYSGALEYTTTDPWYEVREEERLYGAPAKGWLLLPQLGGEPEFRRIGPARPHIDLGMLDCADMTAAAADHAMFERIDGTDITGAVARLRVVIGRQIRRDLDHAGMRQRKGRALNLQVEMREEASSMALQERREGTFRKLDEVLREALQDRPLPDGIDRETFVRSGLEYFEAVRESVPDNNRIETG